MMKIAILRARGAEPDSRCAQGDEHLAAQALGAAGVLPLLLTLWPGTAEPIVEMELRGPERAADGPERKTWQVSQACQVLALRAGRVHELLQS